MSQPRTITLQHPLVTVFKSGDGERTEELTELTLRTDIRAKDLRAMDRVEGQVAKSLELIAHLTGLTVKQVDELSVADFAEIGGIVGELMPDGLGTGAKD